MAQPPFAVAGLLLLTIAFRGGGMIVAVALPVFRVAAPPFAYAVAADLAILRVDGDFLPVIVSAALSLTERIAADHLTGLILRRLEGLLAIAATPIIHEGVVSLNRRTLEEIDLAYFGLK
jgi:hypothetical protein